MLRKLPLCAAVTVLRGTTDAPSHTFSWFSPSTPEAQAVAGILQAFVAEHLPGT